MQKPQTTVNSTYTPLVRAVSFISSIGMLSSGLVLAQNQGTSDSLVDNTNYSTIVEPAPAIPNIPIAPPESAAPQVVQPEAITPAPIDYSNVYIDPTNYTQGATENAYQEPSSVVLSERSSGCEAVLGAGESAGGGVCGGAEVPPAASEWTQEYTENTEYAPPAPEYAPPAPEYASPAPEYASPAPEYAPPAPEYASPAPEVEVATPPAEAPAPVEQSEPLQVPYAPSPAPQPSYAPAPQVADYSQPESTIAQPQPAAPEVNETYSETYAETAEPAQGIQPVNVGPLSVSANGIRFGASGMNNESYNPTQPPASLPFFPGNGNRALLFPLTIPAPITSAFGWRLHPLGGGNSFHSGTDLGGAMGTPVLAALKGVVEVADYLGGYGLAVIIKHNQGTQETLYGHLSELFVRPGQQIEQGMPIGRVGNTGNSTGPHLHFEFRQLTANGWQSLDAGRHLEIAMAQMVQGFRTAQAVPPPPVKKGEIPVIALPAPQEPLKGPVLEAPTQAFQPPNMPVPTESGLGKS